MEQNYFKRVLWILFVPYNYLFFSLYDFFKSLSSGYNPRNTHGQRVFLVISIFTFIISINIIHYQFWTNFYWVNLSVFSLCSIPFAIFKEKIVQFKTNTLIGKLIVFALIVETIWLLWHQTK